MDKIGIAGTIFAALCCLGFPALISIVSAIGIGFLINDAILVPLLVVFLLVTLIGLYLGIRHHCSWLAFVVGAISAIVIFIAVGMVRNELLAIVGIAGLIVASILNVWLRMSHSEPQAYTK
ncbi:MAG TPA: MerC domain-containing protein [Candidatus Udaeobacter sp.]|nr:MerC domain-containing protein [Candidatus Udaeobacter sp.]